MDGVERLAVMNDSRRRFEGSARRYIGYEKEMSRWQRRLVFLMFCVRGSDNVDEGKMKVK